MYRPEKRPEWERPHDAYVGMPFQTTSAAEQRHLMEEQDAALAADLQVQENWVPHSHP